MAKIFSIAVKVTLNMPNLRDAMRADSARRQVELTDKPQWPPAVRYPWDNRPLKYCSVPASTWIEECEPPTKFETDEQA